jgi:hypothetical protein
MYIHTHEHTHTHKHIHTYAFQHTYTHTYIHTRAERTLCQPCPDSLFMYMQLRSIYILQNDRMHPSRGMFECMCVICHIFMYVCVLHVYVDECMGVLLCVHVCMHECGMRVFTYAWVFYAYVCTGVLCVVYARLYIYIYIYIYICMYVSMHGCIVTYYCIFIHEYTRRHTQNKIFPEIRMVHQTTIMPHMCVQVWSLVLKLHIHTYTHTYTHAYMRRLLCRFTYTKRQSCLTCATKPGARY